MTEPNQFVPLKRVFIYCDGCRTPASVDLPKDKKVGYCPCCGGCGVVVERMEWLKP